MPYDSVLTEHFLVRRVLRFDQDGAGVLAGFLQQGGFLFVQVFLQRQGFVKTGISLVAVTALCALCLLWVGML